MEQKRLIMIYGYARVSTQDQNLDMQIEALNKYHCDEIITEKKSGTSLERPAFKKLLDTLRKDDTLVVYKLGFQPITQILKYLSTNSHKSTQENRVKLGNS